VTVLNHEENEVMLGSNDASKQELRDHSQGVANVISARYRYSLCSASFYLSCICLIVVSICCVRSYYRIDLWRWNSTTGLGSASLWIVRGRIIYESIAYQNDNAWRFYGHGADDARSNLAVMLMRRSSDWGWWQSRGVVYRHYVDSESKEMVIGMPIWGAILVALAIPTKRLAGLIRRRQRKWGGRCPGCGYDVRSSSDRCPECGESM
jgi:hypothetical protein